MKKFYYIKPTEILAFFIVAVSLSSLIQKNETLKLNAAVRKKRTKTRDFEFAVGLGWCGNRYWRLDYLRVRVRVTVYVGHYLLTFFSLQEREKLKQELASL